MAHLIAGEITAQLRGRNLDNKRDVDDGVPSFEETRLKTLAALDQHAARSHGKTLLTTRGEAMEALLILVTDLHCDPLDYVEQRLSDATMYTINKLFAERHELAHGLEVELAAMRSERWGWKGSAS